MNDSCGFQLIIILLVTCNKIKKTVRTCELYGSITGKKIYNPVMHVTNLFHIWTDKSKPTLERNHIFFNCFQIKNVKLQYAFYEVENDSDIFTFELYSNIWKSHRALIIKCVAILSLIWFSTFNHIMSFSCDVYGASILQKFCLNQQQIHIGDQSCSCELYDFLLEVKQFRWIAYK